MARTLTFLAFAAAPHAVAAPLAARVRRRAPRLADAALGVYAPRADLSLVVLDGVFAGKWGQQSFAVEDAPAIVAGVCADVACRGWLVNVFDGPSCDARCLAWDDAGRLVVDDRCVVSAATPDALLFAPVRRFERAAGATLLDGFAFTDAVGARRTLSTADGRLVDADALLDGATGDGPLAERLLADARSGALPLDVLRNVARRGAEADERPDAAMKQRIDAIAARALAKLRGG